MAGEVAKKLERAETVVASSVEAARVRNFILSE